MNVQRLLGLLLVLVMIIGSVPKATIWQTNGKEGDGILSKVRSIKVSSFDDKRSFVVTERVRKEANIGCMDNVFKHKFFSKVEENVDSTRIAIHRLEKDSIDKLILKELGKEREETSLTHFFVLLKNQSRGQSGPLLTNGYGNVAYIKGNDGNLWAVCANWNRDDYYWGIFAHPIDSTNYMFANRQVISSD